MSSRIDTYVQSARFPNNNKTFYTAVFVAITYFLGAQAAFLIGTLSDRFFAPFWPPNIVLFCTLLLVPKRQWWLYIAATFPAHVMAELTVDMSGAQIVVAFATNCMVATLNAYGVRRFLGEPPWFETLRSASIYILITAWLSPAISAGPGAFVQILGEGESASYWTSWANWYLSNALGAVTLGPVFLSWFSGTAKADRSNPRKFEAILLALSLTAVCVVAFQGDAERAAIGFLPALLYSPLPLILWAAIRFGQRGASGAILIVTVVSIWQSLREATMFMDVDPERNVLALQVFLMGIAVPIFFLGAAIDELRRSGEQTRELTGAVLRAEDEERRRIARELHDSTGQNLVVAELMVRQVQGMAPTTCEPVMAELSGILRRSIMEVRTISYLLHPPLLDGSGLDPALRSYLEGFSKRTGIKVDLELSPDIGRMPSHMELALFRVVQEALTNVWRHSGSATARVRIERKDSPAESEITLSIEDSGKGIPKNIQQSALSRVQVPHRAPEGLGLVSMRERLHQIGGALEIDSTIGKTVIRATVKLNTEEPPFGSLPQ